MTITSPAVHPALASTRLAGLELANRLVVAPMTRVSATPDGHATEQMRDYYAAFARGGFGLVVTEGTYTDTLHSQGYANQPGLATESHVESWCPVVSAVHAEGGRIVAQLMHAGALSQGNAYSDETIAPSAVPPLGTMLTEYGGAGAWPTPRAMTTADIDGVVDGFAAAARAAQQAGFDGVEIHGANGYLPDQFLTDYTNVRTDRYGGDVVARVRFVAEITGAVRAAVDAGVVVGVRLSQTKVNDFTHRWAGGAADVATIVAAIADEGADYLHIASEGRDWIDTARLDSGETVTELARRVTGLPVIANGGMHDAAQAGAVIREGHADLVSVARGALANADLPRRLAAHDDLHPFDHGMLHPMATLENADRWRSRR